MSTGRKDCIFSIWCNSVYVGNPIIYMERPTPGISDAIVSVAAAVILYIIPNTKGSRILDSDSVKKFPWAVILMLWVVWL